MGPLQEIIDGASGSSTPVSTLLRKLKVVAARMQTEELAEWVDHELQGYPEGSRLPDYRGPFDAEVKGHFGGPFGSGIRNAGIPPIGFPADFRQGQLFKVQFPQPIAEIEQLSGSDRHLEQEWSSDAIALVNSMTQSGEVHLYEGMGLQQAWKMISPVQLAGIVDTVRTRVLDLALGLERLQPDAGTTDAPAVDAGAVQQIVTNNIYGTANVAVGGTNVNQAINFPDPGDRTGLLASLETLGVDPEMVRTLEDAMDQDAAEGSADGGIGTRVRDWIANYSLKAAASGAASAAAGLAVKAIAAYYGLAA